MSIKKFEVDIYQLKNGTYSYDFEIDDTFFQLLGTSLVSKGNLKTHVTLDKDNDFYKIKFLIKGNVNLVCDRSLEEYEQYLNIDKTLIVRYGD
ncbi:MAG TPA: DUF177 domain-containing protein, partial [Cytophagales bacterium]|nr:DUF177 domain-containing protein [Cytophagales bacterium]